MTDYTAVPDGQLIKIRGEAWALADAACQAALDEISILRTFRPGIPEWTAQLEVCDATARAADMLAARHRDIIAELQRRTAEAWKPSDA